MMEFKLLLLITCLFISQVIVAQNPKGITMSFENASLDTVLDALTKQTDKGFTLTTECLNQAPPITIKAKNAPLTDILDMICKGSPFTYHISHDIIFLAPRPVRGQVTDEMGKPIAAVKVQAGDNSALTNSRGEFYLRNAACDPIIKFSHPGDSITLRHPGKTYIIVHMRNRTTITAN